MGNQNQKSKFGVIRDNDSNKRSKIKKYLLKLGVPIATVAAVMYVLKNGSKNPDEFENIPYGNSDSLP